MSNYEERLDQAYYSYRDAAFDVYTTMISEILVEERGCGTFDYEDEGFCQSFWDTFEEMKGLPQSEMPDFLWECAQEFVTYELEEE